MKTEPWMNEPQKKQEEVLTEINQLIDIAQVLALSIQREDSQTQGTFLSSLESTYVSLVNKLDYPSQIAKEKEERHERIKKANQKIRKLKDQLGEELSVHSLPELMKHLEKTVSNWWKAEGFYFSTDTRFHPHGYEIDLHFMLNHYQPPKEWKGHLRTKTKQIDHFKKEGFQFADFEESESEQLKLLDLPENRKRLIKMIKERFPSAEVRSFENRQSEAEEETFVISSCRVCIHDFSDI